MADMFGDSSLFDEFERERPHNLYIPTDPDDSEQRPLIEVDDSESDSDGAASSSSEIQEIKENKEEKNKGDNQDYHNDNTTIVIDDSPMSPIESNRKTDNRDEYVSAIVSNKSLTKTQHKLLRVCDTANETSLSNDVCVAQRLHAVEPDEKSLQENKTLRRYANLVDTTRYNPSGDESSALQLFYQNNKFARKYRADIECYIQYLIEQDKQQSGNDKLPELQLQTGGLTSADLHHSKECQIDVRLRRVHAYLGCSRLYRDFAIDTLGWPLIDDNPSLTHGRITAHYDQCFPNCLPCDELAELRSSAQPKKSKQICFNCSGDHMLTKCPEPRNEKVIRDNQRQFRQKNTNTPKLGLSSNSNKGDKYNHIKPGVYSDALLEAMGLNEKQLPPFIYSMRLLGYPPGWNMDAKKLASGLSLFDKHGKEVAIEGEPEIIHDPNQHHLNSLDVGRIIEYPGFTVDPPDGYIEECHLYSMPQLQPHQLKSTVVNYMNTQEAERKRRSEEQRELMNKRRKCDRESDMDLVTDEDMSTPIKPSSDPPLPENNSPFRPPLPEETPPTSLPSTPSSQCRSDLDISDSMTIEDLQSKYDALHNEIHMNSGNSGTTGFTDKTTKRSLDMTQSMHDETDASDAQKLNETIEFLSPQSPDDNQIIRHPDPRSPRSNDSSKSITGSIERTIGTPVQMSVTPNLPNREQFSSGVEEHIPFENLHEATGRFDKLRQMLSKLRDSAKNAFGK